MCLLYEHVVKHEGVFGSVVRQHNVGGTATCMYNVGVGKFRWFSIKMLLSTTLFYTFAFKTFSHSP